MARLKLIILILLLYVKLTKAELCAPEFALGMHYACPTDYSSSILSNPAGLYKIQTSCHVFGYEFKEKTSILLMSQPFIFLKNAGIGFGFFKEDNLKKAILGLSFFKLWNISTGLNIKLIKNEKEDYGFDLGCLYKVNKLNAGICLYDLGLEDEKFIIGVSYGKIWDKLTLLLNYNYKDNLGIGCEWYLPVTRLSSLEALRAGVYKGGLTMGLGIKFRTISFNLGYYSKNAQSIISIHLY